MNSLKTAALLGALSGLILLAGLWLGGSSGLTLALILAGGMNAGSYYYSDRIALRSMRARPVGQAEQPEMYAIVAELARAARQPMPRLYVSPTMAPNAFATGRNPRNAAVCATEGILTILDRRELRGVLGHELAHVYSRDILTSSVAATLASVVMYLSHFAFFGAMFGGSSDDDDGGSNPVAMLLLLVLGPVAASLIQLAISRSREFSADASGAELTGDPLALASALRKLHAGTRALPLPQEDRLMATSHLMIASPFAGGGLASLFATHPPMLDRVARLEAMAYTDPRF